MTKEISDERLEKYFSVTREAIEKVVITSPDKTPFEAMARDMLEMAKTYFQDAYYFRDQGDEITAFAALNYAHGWLDAGARIGLFDVGHDSHLFTVD